MTSKQLFFLKNRTVCLQVAAETSAQPNVGLPSAPAVCQQLDLNFGQNCRIAAKNVLQDLPYKDENLDTKKEEYTDCMLKGREEN